MFDELIKDFVKKKEEIVQDKINELGIEFSFEEEKRRRFKNFLIETTEDGEETYWYNDGSDQGLRIVTFRMRTPDICNIEEPFKIELKADYY